MDRQEFTQRYLRPLDAADSVPRLPEEEIPEFRALCAELGFVGMASCLINEGAPGSIAQILRFSGFDMRRLRDGGVLAGPFLTADGAAQQSGVMLFESPPADGNGDYPEAA